MWLVIVALLCCSLVPEMEKVYKKRKEKKESLSNSALIGLVYYEYGSCLHVSLAGSLTIW